MTTTTCEHKLAGGNVKAASAPVNLAGVVSWLLAKVTTFPAVLAAVIVAKVFWTCRDRIAEPDIWWHLVNAKQIISTHTFPNVDTHSYTTLGMAWTDHAWLAEVVFYGAFRALGLLGLYFAFATCLSAIMLLVFRMCLREGSDAFAACVATVVGGLLAMVGYGPRTHIFGWLCCAAVFAILLQFRAKRTAPLWALPLIFCAWVNLHASWTFGVFLFCIVLIAGLVKRDIGHLKAAPWSRAELKTLIITGGLSLLALLVNPFGYRMLMFPVNVLFRLPLSIGYTQEFAPIDFADSRGTIVAAVMCVVFVLAFAARKPWRVDDALLVIFVLYCGLTHIRFLFLAGIVLPPILAPKVGEVTSYDGVHERRLLNGTVLALIAAVTVLCIPSRKTLDAQIEEYFPVRAMGYLKANPPSSHVFHPDIWGGYMQWHLPQVQTFMDTRADIFEYKGVTRDYLNAVLLKESPLRMLDKYQVSDVLYPSDSAFVRYLAIAPQWQCVYADGQSVIYRRVHDDSRTAKGSN